MTLRDALLSTIHQAWSLVPRSLDDLVGLVVLVLSLYASYALVVYPLVYPRWLSPLRHVPGPPLPRNPILGHLREMMLIKDISIQQREWVKQYGGLVRVVMPLGRERLIVTSKEALRTILVSDWIHFPRPHYLRRILGLVAGHGLLTVEGDVHKHMRKAMNPAFSIPNLIAQTDMFYDSINSLIDILQSQIEAELTPNTGKVFPMYDWLSKATLDIICETAFGYRPDSLHNPDNELAVAYHRLLQLQSGKNFIGIITLTAIPGLAKLMGSKWGYEHRHWFSFIPLLAPAAQVVASMYTIKRIAGEMLKQKIADEYANVQADDLAAKRDVMSLLVRARKRDEEAVAGKPFEGAGSGGYRMTDDDMMNQVLTFLGAGHETTASGLAWTLWLLANDPASQCRLREEVTPFIAQDSRPSYKTLKDMKWLDCIVMESLRLMPPVPGTPRRTAKGGILDGVYVPKRTTIEIHIRVINTLKDVWGEDAEMFNPARFLSDKVPEPTFSHLSFLAGPHACIGRALALLEMKAVLALLIARFEFSIPEGRADEASRERTAITMKPAEGMPLLVKTVGAKESV